MKLSLIDFKKHENSEVDLDGNTVITGRNGEGKTSILEGIVFTLFGRNFYGKVATDMFVRKGSLGATGILSMGGTEIKRTVGKENSVYLNGAKSKVAEVGSLFPSAEMALPVINPLYFMYEMSDIEKRELFMKLLPSIDREEVFKKHYSDRKDLVDRFNNSTLKEIREQIKNSEVILKANASQIATYELDIRDRQEEIKKMREAMPEAPKGVLEKEKEIQKELDEAQKELGLLGNPHVQIEQYDKELAGYTQQALPVVRKLGVQNISQAVEKIKKAVEALENEFEQLRNDYAKYSVMLEQLKQFESGRCPLCKQPVTTATQRIEEVKKEKSQTEQRLTELKMKIDKYKQVLRQLQDLSDNVQRCINGKQLSEKKVSKYEKLVERIKELESQLVGNSKEDFRKAVEVEKIKENIRLIQNEITRKKGTISKLKETNKKLENDMPDLKLLEEALSNSGVDAWVAKEQAKVIENMVSKYMKLEVITVLENKTNDNTKEVFEIMKDGVSFRSMSFGERIKVSVAFGLVLRELMKGFNLPFVLLDEGSVLSEDTLAEIKKWLNEQGVDLIYTKASDTKLSVKKDA